MTSSDIQNSLNRKLLVSVWKMIANELPLSVAVTDLHHIIQIIWHIIVHSVLILIQIVLHIDFFFAHFVYFAYWEVGISKQSI